jgi:hypothetical protein
MTAESFAALSGNLEEYLKYSHEHGCPWDKNTTQIAAEGGYLDCLKYAYENGCPWDKYTIVLPAKGLILYGVNKGVRL